MSSTAAAYAIVSERIEPSSNAPPAWAIACSLTGAMSESVDMSPATPNNPRAVSSSRARAVDAASGSLRVPSERSATGPDRARISDTS